MVDWKSRWRSLVSLGRDREAVLDLKEAERSASDVAEPRADEPSDAADELASDDVAAAPVDSAAGAAEEPELPAVWTARPEPVPAEPVPPQPTADFDAGPAAVVHHAVGEPTAVREAVAALAEGLAAVRSAPAPQETVPEDGISAAIVEAPPADEPAPAAAESAPAPAVSAAPAALPAGSGDLLAELRYTALRLEQALADERLRRERLEREVAGLSDSDPLTGLASARRFNDRLGVAVTHALRQKHKLAIVQLGIDRFESVRDGVGASQGDDVLRSVALALESTLRQGDTIARLGSDPVFTILLPGVKRDEDVTVIADKLRLALRSPFTIGGCDLLVTASIGMALFPDDGSDTESLLQSAGLAMERAQEKGGDAWDVHAPGSRARAARRQARETALQRALVRGGLELYWQPVVTCEAGAIAGVESLLRWRGGDRPPVASDFVALADVSGLAVPLGQWLLRAACRQLGAWRRLGYGELALGVSVSARQLAHGAFVKLVRRALDEGELPAAALELAIPASELASSPEPALERLAELRALGIRVALDAFGSAESRLADPHRYPLDSVRLDAAVVRDAVTSGDQAALIRACVALARSRRLRVVAPGADSEAHRALLVRLRCDLMFGRLYGGPMPAAEAERHLRGWRDRASGQAAGVPGRRLL